MAHGQRAQNAQLTGSSRCVILASGSPRRHELFKAFGVPFRIIVPRARESLTNQRDPKDLVKRNAVRKAKAAASDVKRGVIVSADTVVVCQGRLFGKPKNAREATQMLRWLSGRPHRVYTGVCVRDVDRDRTFLDVAMTRVTMRRLSASSIDRSLRTLGLLDKAGAYAVQEIRGMFIDRIEGSLSNVVGLPLHLVEKRLRQCGVLR